MQVGCMEHGLDFAGSEALFVCSFVGFCGAEVLVLIVWRACYQLREKTAAWTYTGVCVYTLLCYLGSLHGVCGTHGASHFLMVILGSPLLSVKTDSSSQLMAVAYQSALQLVQAC